MLCVSACVRVCVCVCVCVCVFVCACVSLCSIGTTAIGQARITTGYALPSSRIIHAIAPISTAVCGGSTVML